MVGWLLLALGVAFGSAVLPLMSIEVFVLALVAHEPGVPWLALGAVVALGQIAGKTLYFLAARGSITLPRVLRERPRRARRSRRPSRLPAAWRLRWRLARRWIAVRLEALRERCYRHPHWMTGTYGLSSLLGLPPFMATSVLAGLVRMRLSTFLAAGVLGRLVRFSALAAAPALIGGWAWF